MDGHPKQSKRDVRTLAIEFSEDVGSVSDIDGEDPPIEVYGPLAEDETAEDAFPPILPIDVDIEDSIVEFSFDPPLGTGRYRVVVYQGGYEKASSGTDFDLGPFTGWDLQVHNTSQRHNAEGGEQELKSTEPTGPRLKAVLLDGEAAEKAVGLSAETLTVVTTEPAEVSLTLRPLLQSARKPLYERYVTKNTHAHEGNPAVTFAAAGPIRDYKWAVQPENTTGQLPLDDEQNLAWAAPVVREPTEAQFDPMVDASASTRTGTIADPPNEYHELNATVTPQAAAAPISSYEARTVLWPKTINNERATPDRHPGVYEDSVYEDHDTDDPLKEKFAAYDLPLHTELIVEINGRRVWTGQTPLLPTLVTPMQVKRELGWDVEAKPMEVRRSIWHASLEAVRLWGCSLPTEGPTSSMQEFVLTYLENPIDRTSGTMNEMRTRLGDQSVDAQSDRSGKRRLSALASILKDCKAGAPLYPEDKIPAASAGVGQGASDEYYKPKTADTAARRIAPMARPLFYSRRPPYKSEFHRLDL